MLESEDTGQFMNYSYSNIRSLIIILRPLLSLVVSMILNLEGTMFLGLIIHFNTILAINFLRIALNHYCFYLVCFI